MLSVSDVVPGDEITIRFTCKASEQGSINASAAVLDDTLFWQAYDVLNASTLQLNAFESTLVEGTIDCNRDGILYTSIPQNGNWHAYVDGKEAEIILIGDCMIGVSLTAGNHTVTFRYVNKAFHVGLAVSITCTLVFLVIAIAVPVIKSKTKKGKYEK
jgi:uncharacterized membrane protein YfhO